MQLTSAQVKTQIITGGISCLPACSGGLITGNIFHLAGCIEVEVQPVLGGSHPMAPGEVANMYQPVEPPAGLNDHPAFYVPPNQIDPFSVKNHVTIRVTFNDKTTEKEYIVSEKKAKAIVYVAKFINKTEERIKVLFNGLQKVSKHAVRVINFRKRDK